MRAVVIAATVIGCMAQQPSKPRFRSDDPLWQLPPPTSVENVFARSLSDYYDYFLNTFASPGEEHTDVQWRPAQAINTLGEVPDSEWYTNRHYFRPMTTDAIVQGAPGRPPAEGKWTIMAAKNEGVTPGFTIIDEAKNRYVLKFDPPAHPELATSADVISSKFFHALGYNVPANYIVEFDRDRLVLGENTMLRDRLGRRRPMTSKDLGEILTNTPRDKQGRFRAVASFYLSGTPIGPFRYHGTRRDDPNDTVLHEHRRDLRGLRVFCAWLGHDDSRSINTLDMLVDDGGRKYVKHYLIDFGSTLGSASYGPNSPRSGNEYVFSWKAPAAEFFTLGLYVPRWTRAHFPNLPAVGRFESEVFDAEKWVPEYRNPAFSNQMPDDAFWAARQVMAFTDEQIRRVVASAGYSDPRATEWVTKCLFQRRDKIGKAYFAKVLPLDQFSVEQGRLKFVDLAEVHKLGPQATYKIEWSRFDNHTQQSELIPGAIGEKLPVTAPYLKATISAGDVRAVDIYVRTRGGESDVVGVERRW